MRLRILIAVLLGGAVLGSGIFAEEPKLENSEQKTLYTLGFALSQRLAPFELGDEELAFVQAGLADGIRAREPRVSIDEFGPQIDAMLRARAGKITEREKQAGAELCSEAEAEDGAVKLASGAIYKALTSGDGAAPGPTDTVKVHYQGTLRDGTVFDSSREGPEPGPATFSLDGVIPCFSEGIQQMKVGGKGKLTCPSDAAYGDNGFPPRIKPGAALVFEVELLEISPAADTPANDS